jgi:hypothetical protein
MKLAGALHHCGGELGYHGSRVKLGKAERGQQLTERQRRIPETFPFPSLQ